MSGKTKTNMHPNMRPRAHERMAALRARDLRKARRCVFTSYTWCGCSGHGKKNLQQQRSFKQYEGVQLCKQPSLASFDRAKPAIRKDSAS